MNECYTVKLAVIEGALCILGNGPRTSAVSAVHLRKLGLIRVQDLDSWSSAACHSE